MARKPKTAPKRKRGRPDTYTPRIANAICEQLAEGKSLRSICEADGMPSEVTVRSWALNDWHGFSAQYSRARELGYHKMADDLMDIADDGRNDYIETDVGPVLNSEHVQRSRLRVDTRKWMLSKTLPKIYGDKLALTDPDGGALTINVVNRAND